MIFEQSFETALISNQLEIITRCRPHSSAPPKKPLAPSLLKCFFVPKIFSSTKYLPLKTTLPNTPKVLIIRIRKERLMRIENLNTQQYID